ncbi:MAG TPA: penicillin-binding transpeptidase domain-containing protein [Propionibacteriaceae bacterium]|nr:penicillin-binding transpeptidase domain-containing protein [Propionibacteriaceae bacterium]
MRRLRSAVCLVSLTLLAACSTGIPTPDPRPTDIPDRAATELATGLTSKDLTAVEFVGATGTEVNELYQPLVTGMGAREPQVTVASVKRQGSTATATLNTTWTFPGVEPRWSYTTEASLTEDGGRWRTSWQPNLVQAQLDGTNRLSQSRLDPERGELLGEDGDPIVQLRPVVRIGLDKSELAAEAVDASVRRLARLVSIDAKAYAAEVAAAGPRAFVEAIVFRTTDPDRPRNREVFAIPGALPIEDDQMLGPSRDFARPIIGSVGEATKEIVDKSGGTVVAGDQVGISGLQQRYDQQLRGTPGVRVQLVGLKTTGSSASPSPSATPSTAPAVEPVTVFESKPVAGKPLETTLSIALQGLAERTLAGTKPVAALVAIRPSTGAVVAAANNAATKGQSLATVGRAAPGSTFKVVSALALLRAGLNPDSAVSCPNTVTVDGKEFENYDDYPGSAVGTIRLQTALAQSCNTAFIGQRDKIKGQALAEAAGSLGVGIDYDTGFTSFLGSVPDDPTATGRAAALIGQGKVEASPLAMAGVVASVSAGQTVLPYLVEGSTRPKAEGKQLTAEEADQLRQMMRTVVTSGSGRVLSGVDGAVIAKTGTAEYGPTAPYKTHAWMIAGTGDLAVAVFVQDGESGSRTAGPLLRTFLNGAGRT